MKSLERRLDPLQAREAARQIALSIPVRPSLGLILGSGWATVATSLTNAFTLDYQEIPYFAQTRVQGHPGCLLAGELTGRQVVILSGRPHIYEGYDMAQVAFPVLVLKELGVTDLILTNASGGLNPSLVPGDLMIITDHINMPGLTGLSPLAGAPGAFVDMAAAYDPSLVQLARSVASSLSMQVREGVYAMVGGPTYETRAEARLLRSLGADAVGMSTVPEVIAARWSGLRTLGLSLITNHALQPGAGLTHEDVLRKVETEAPRLKRFMEYLIGQWPL